eukprot:TRINITY_DN3641_c0_g1_i1.p1 TRINITY_DN3641_c0_g1~~TRINITY_DN3641_c0_g1_i1.p1  ORF type:complete len:772 (-),score=190.44 TRINITY_DN3641_c0_g1_i1:95-2410(-)
MASAGRPIVWTGDSIVRCAERYKEMVSYLCSHSPVVASLAAVLDPGDYDNFSRALINVSLLAGGAEVLIQELTRREFEISKDSVGTILRANSIASKVQSAYTRVIAADYLRELLGPLLTLVTNDPELSLEINPSKVDAPAAKKSEVVAERQAALAALAQKFLDQLLLEESIVKMPKETKAIAAHIGMLARKFVPQAQTSLVGGFVILRIFNPAILAPEGFDILPQGVHLSPENRRTLVLITKLIQNLSNNVPFGGKEEFMAPMNSFVEANSARMQAYLTRLAGNDDTPPPAASTVQDFDIRAASLQDLIVLHRMLNTYGVKCTGTPAEMGPFRTLVDMLGAPPIIAKTKHRPASGAVNVTDESAGPATPQPQSPLNSGAADRLLQAMDAAKFFFRGPPDKAGRPVFYVIVNRVSTPFLEDFAVLARHVLKVMDSHIHSPYAICVDMSWATATSEQKVLVFQQLSQFWDTFTRSQRKNLSALYVVHPNTFMDSVLFLIKTFTSKKFSQKIFKIYEWENLSEWISAENIALPDDTKEFTTRTYSLIKVNSKGKRQTRLLKFTGTSLLNIDPKTRTIKNEITLATIEQLSVTPADSDIYIRFKPSSQNEPMSKLSSPRMLLSLIKDKDKDESELDERHYICKDVQERDEILFDIFESGFNSGAITAPQSFNVIKVNKAGKHQERVFKLTCDSVLNIHNAQIKSEISFAGIESVTQDGPDSVWLKLKGEEKPRRIICPQGERLCHALTLNLTRFKRDAEVQGQQDKLDGIGMHWR